MASSSIRPSADFAGLLRGTGLCYTLICPCDTVHVTIYLVSLLRRNLFQLVLKPLLTLLYGRFPTTSGF